MTNGLFSDAYKAMRAIATREVYLDVDKIPFHFKHVPLKKIINWIRVESSMRFKPGKPWGWPTHIQIEPTTLCNLRCALCPVTEGLQRVTGHMSLDLFRKTVDEAGEYAFLLLFWDWGEPFLNPAAYDMIRYAKSKWIGVVSSTNGHVFAKKDHAQELVSSGIDAIIFALDGITQQTYEYYREGGNLDTALAGIRNVVAAKQHLKSKTPLINFRFLVTSHNQQEVPALEDFVRTLGVDMLSLKTLNSNNNMISKEGKAYIPQAYRRFEYDPVTGERIRRSKGPACKTLWNSPTIHWNGKISPCTYDAHDRNILGDITDDHFKDIWWGEPYVRFRRQHCTEYEKIPLCNECSFAFVGGACGVETIADAHFFEMPGKE